MDTKNDYSKPTTSELSKKMKDTKLQYARQIKEHNKSIKVINKLIDSGVLSTQANQALRQDIIHIQDKIAEVKSEQKIALAPLHVEQKQEKVVNKKITDKEVLPFVQEAIDDTKTMVDEYKKELKGRYFKQNGSRFVRDFTDDQKDKLKKTDQEHKKHKREILDDAKETYKEDIIQKRLGIPAPAPAPAPAPEPVIIDEDVLQKLIDKTKVYVKHGAKQTDSKMVINFPEALNVYFWGAIRPQYPMIRDFIQGDLEGNKTKKVSFTLSAFFTKPNAYSQTIHKVVEINSVLATDVLNLDAVMRQGDELFNKDEGESGLFFVGFKYITIESFNTQMSIGGEYWMLWRG